MTQAFNNLGKASTFGAWSNTSIINSGATDIVGDIGTTGTSITGFHLGNLFLTSQTIRPYKTLRLPIQPPPPYQEQSLSRRPSARSLWVAFVRTTGRGRRFDSVGNRSRHNT
jgi:hypothetical protein